MLVGNSPSVFPGSENTYASYGRAWANLSNTPFRLYKRWVHEGGISSPLIAHWPGGGLDAGTVSMRPAQLVDILPTILETTGAADAVPERCEGSSLLDYWRPGADLGRESGDRALYWEHIGNAAIREGQWKLVREEGQDWELYDLSRDRTELKNLADAQPDLAQRLEAKWRNWAQRVGVIPWENVVALYTERGLTKEAARG